MSGPLRSKTKAGRAEVGLEYWFENELGCTHEHPVPEGGYAERPFTRLPGLWDVDPSQRLGAIAMPLDLCGERVEEGRDPFDPPGLDRVDRDPVDAGRTLVGGHVDPGLPHHVTAGELVVEGMESPYWVLLGTAVEHALEGLEITDAFFFRDLAGPCPGVVVAGDVGVGRLI